LLPRPEEEAAFSKKVTEKRKKNGLLSSPEKERGDPVGEKEKKEGRVSLPEESRFRRKETLLDLKDQGYFSGERPSGPLLQGREGGEALTGEKKKHAGRSHGSGQGKKASGIISVDNVSA